MNDIAQRMLAQIDALAPAIRERAVSIEKARQLPADLVDELRAIGLFRLYVPPSHGGLGFDPLTAMHVVQALSRIDGSVGWTAGVCAAEMLFATRLPRATFDRIYARGPDAIVAGAVQPTGTLERTAQGWRADGRWSFASGCTHADWLFGICVVTERGKPLPGRLGAGGPPLMRGVMLPAREWQIEDTWQVAGLEGTGSHHIALRHAAVAEDCLFDPADGPSCIDGPLYRAVPPLLPPMGSAIVLGMAEAALDAIVELAGSGRQQFRVTVPMRDSELFQGELGRVEAELRAARALHNAEAAALWRSALHGKQHDEAAYVRATQSATWIAHACVRVADACFALGGGAALYDTSPLQRCLRNLHAAAQHTGMHPRHYVSAAKLLLRTGLQAHPEEAA
jgi:alkylation response protein AidB-like acyl-CoA dehydrogenase